MSQPAVIGGKSVECDAWIDVVDPATGQAFDRTVRGTAAEVDASVEAGRSASDAWCRAPYAERSVVLRRIADLVRRDHEQLAVRESRDTGKPLTQARADVTVAARYFEFYANALEVFFGHSLPLNRDFPAYTRNVPFGVTGHIIPWNYPLQIGCRTVAPAIAVGNCAVVKPAEDAPLAVIRVAQLALEGVAGRCAQRRARSRRRGRRRVGPARRHRPLSFTAWCRSGRSWPKPRPTTSSLSRWSSAASRPTSSSPTPGSTGWRR